MVSKIERFWRISNGSEYIQVEVADYGIVSLTTSRDGSKLYLTRSDVEKLMEVFREIVHD